MTLIRFEYDNSYCNVKPSTCRSRRGTLFSNVDNRTPRLRITASMSGHGAYTRSAATSGWALSTSYKILSPMWLMPIS